MRPERSAQAHIVAGKIPTTASDVMRCRTLFGGSLFIGMAVPQIAPNAHGTPRRLSRVTSRCSRNSAPHRLGFK